MEIAVIALPLIPVAAIAGYILSRLTRPRTAGWVGALFALLALAAVLSGRAAEGPDAVAHPILAVTFFIPLAIGIALGALLDGARRRFGR
jgi:hypothetical protein